MNRPPHAVHVPPESRAVSGRPAPYTPSTVGSTEKRSTLPKRGHTVRPCIRASPRTATSPHRAPTAPDESRQACDAQILDEHRLVLADNRRRLLCAPSLVVSRPLWHEPWLPVGVLARLLLPFCLRDRSCCALRSLRSARRRNFGAPITRPSERTAKLDSPRSIPTSSAIEATLRRSSPPRTTQNSGPPNPFDDRDRRRDGWKLP